MDKVLTATGGTDITIQLRLKVPSGSGFYDFSTKFGLSFEDALGLAKQLSHNGINWALAFHVGSQCEAQHAYVDALQLCQQVLARIDDQPAYINIGGGFPVYVGLHEIKPLTHYFQTIRNAINQFDFPPLICEPGRALVAAAGKLITRILLRDGDRIFLNDGVFGSFLETKVCGFKLKAKVIRLGGRPASELIDFCIFGPTCDSFDALEKLVPLPADLQTGDWLIFDNMGAYSATLASQFNGFGGPQIIMIE